MLQLLAAFGRSYAPYIVFPATLVVGAIGYQLEWWLRKEETPWKKESISDERAKRLANANEGEEFGSLKNPTFIPETIFRDK